MWFNNCFMCHIFIIKPCCKLKLFILGNQYRFSSRPARYCPLALLMATWVSHAMLGQQAALPYTALESKKIWDPDAEKDPL